MKTKRWIAYRINPEILEKIELTVVVEEKGQAAEYQKKFFKLFDEIVQRSTSRIERFYQPSGLLEMLEITTQDKTYRLPGPAFWNHLLATFMEIEQEYANWIDCDWYYLKESQNRSQFHQRFHFVVFDRQEVLIDQKMVLTTQNQVPALMQVFVDLSRAGFEGQQSYKSQQLQVLNQRFPYSSKKKESSSLLHRLKDWLNRILSPK